MSTSFGTSVLANKAYVWRFEMNHKYGEISRKIIKLQNDDGTWGTVFHSLAAPNKKYPLTTEQALRRLRILGFTINDAPIRKAVDCMTACLCGRRKIDNYWEKTHNWELFTQLMLSTWVKIFEPDNELALKFSKRWANIIEKAFESGVYNNDAYIDAYICGFSSEPKGGRELDFSDFYHIHLLQNVLPVNIESQLLNYIITKPNGIYYIYDKALSELPSAFASKETSRYLSALEILSGYKLAKEKLCFIFEWLENNKDENNQWDLGATANDNVYFPLSDSWKKVEYRKADCTEKITTILQALNS
jgi:hypothetical protein